MNFKCVCSIYDTSFMAYNRKNKITFNCFTPVFDFKVYFTLLSK